MTHGELVTIVRDLQISDKHKIKLITAIAFCKEGEIPDKLNQRINEAITESRENEEKRFQKEYKKLQKEYDKALKEFAKEYKHLTGEKFTLV